MQKFFTLLGYVVVLGGVCLGLLGSCNSDDKNSQNISTAILADDPGDGYLLNSTSYTLAVDFDEQETFKINLPPGKLLNLHLTPNKTYVIHVVVLNQAGRAVSEYIDDFFVNDMPLDSQLADFICNWFVEFTQNHPEAGFANRYSS